MTARRRRVERAVVDEHRLSDDIRTLEFAQLLELARERRPGAFDACRACSGRPGPIIDAGELGEGKGLTLTTLCALNAGVLELLQYTSTHHEQDFDVVPPMDAITVLERISKVEDYLTRRATAPFETGADQRRGYLFVTKHRTRGRHGVERLSFSPGAPRSLLATKQLDQECGGSYAAWVETEADDEHLIGEFRGGIVGVAPRKPRRAFEIVLYFRPGARGRICEWTGNQRWGMAQAIREVTGALRLELMVRGAPLDYRWAVHAYPGMDAFVRILSAKTVRSQSTPAEWAQKVRAHLGLE